MQEQLGDLTHCAKTEADSGTLKELTTEIADRNLNSTQRRSQKR
jgi:hypothetical protein